MASNPLRRLIPSGRKRKPWSRKHNPDGTMTLLDHLRELKHRVAIISLALTVGGIIGWIWFTTRIAGLPALETLLREPYCGIPAAQRFPSDQCVLIQQQPFEAFMIQLKVGLGAGAALVSPVWLYQVWAFITPGLYAKERKFARIFVFSASFLFIVGTVLAYVVIPAGLSVLVGFAGEFYVTALSGSSYVSFVLTMLIVFGVSFEMPLVIVMLNRIGAVTYEKLKKWRRGIIFGLFVFAAVATPGTDPVGMVVLALALTVLFEFALQVCRVHDKRKAKRDETSKWANISPDEAAPLDLTPSVPETATPEPAASAELPRNRYDDAT
ncbi:twin-arginine translocase subunit TatC [Allokutzneria sp. NRRL B-24872]|uniref:twin-arginine translocase subunit TatC n=1 Tax=Allokutzneria sp. NRRL B-24872 TaxID=1137961 RepID=UPI001FF05FB8|nr:twin-arginine translocase subunit TatC [Allokutzneria sp. NRRL B-24872]